ncbi:MAG: tetratricopeptide repeat protein [Vicinamibacterales bacterium]
MPPATPRSTAPALWIVVAAACLFFGAIIGYVIATGSGARHAALPAMPPAAAPPPAEQSTPQAALVDERQIRAYRDILARDPDNLQAATALGNMLYDAGRYPEAVTAYRQALSLSPADINISTDLGTALWYSGRSDEALAQYERSLAIDPNHGQTLFNRGIVLLDGKNDPEAAAASWEKLLETNPDYPDRERVRQLIAKARNRL